MSTLNLSANQEAFLAQIHSPTAANHVNPFVFEPTSGVPNSPKPIAAAACLGSPEMPNLVELNAGPALDDNFSLNMAANHVNPFVFEPTSGVPNSPNPIAAAACLGSPEMPNLFELNAGPALDDNFSLNMISVPVPNPLPSAMCLQFAPLGGLTSFNNNPDVNVGPNPSVSFEYPVPESPVLSTADLFFSGKDEITNSMSQSVVRGGTRCSFLSCSSIPRTSEIAAKPNLNMKPSPYCPVAGVRVAVTKLYRVLFRASFQRNNLNSLRVPTNALAVVCKNYKQLKSELAEGQGSELSADYLTENFPKQKIIGMILRECIRLFKEGGRTINEQVRASTGGVWVDPYVADKLKLLMQLLTTLMDLLENVLGDPIVNVNEGANATCFPKSCVLHTIATFFRFRCSVKSFLAAMEIFGDADCEIRSTLDSLNEVYWGRLQELSENYLSESKNPMKALKERADFSNISTTQNAFELFEYRDIANICMAASAELKEADTDNKSQLVLADRMLSLLRWAAKTVTAGFQVLLKDTCQLMHAAAQIYPIVNAQELNFVSEPVDLALVFMKVMFVEKSDLTGCAPGLVELNPACTKEDYSMVCNVLCMIMGGEEDITSTNQGNDRCSSVILSEQRYSTLVRTSAFIQLEEHTRILLFRHAKLVIPGMQAVTWYGFNQHDRRAFRKLSSIVNKIETECPHMTVGGQMTSLEGLLKRGLEIVMKFEQVCKLLPTAGPIDNGNINVNEDSSYQLHKIQITDLTDKLQCDNLNQNESVDNGFSNAPVESNLALVKKY